MRVSEKVFTVHEDEIQVDFQVLKEEWEQDLDAIVGTANNSSCCPLAVAFVREYPNAERVSVWGDSINYTVGGNKRERLWLPSTAQEFIERVDRLASGEGEDGEEVGLQEPVLAIDGLRILREIMGEE